jgi:hypothetical protein
VNGKMDLIFEEPGAPGRCVIVDFKTDREIAPEQHAAQLACYRTAASAFSDFPPETWLFFLRRGVALPINEELDLGLLAGASFPDARPRRRPMNDAPSYSELLDSFEDQRHLIEIGRDLMRIRDRTSCCGESWT